MKSNISSYNRKVKSERRKALLEQNSITSSDFNLKFGISETISANKLYALAHDRNIPIEELTLSDISSTLKFETDKAKEAIIEEKKLDSFEVKYIDWDQVEKSYHIDTYEKYVKYDENLPLSLVKKILKKENINWDNIYTYQSEPSDKKEEEKDPILSKKIKAAQKHFTEAQKVIEISNKKLNTEKTLIEVKKIDIIPPYVNDRKKILAFMKETHYKNTPEGEIREKYAFKSHGFNFTSKKGETDLHGLYRTGDFKGIRLDREGEKRKSIDQMAIGHETLFGDHVDLSRYEKFPYLYPIPIYNPLFKENLQYSSLKKQSVKSNILWNRKALDKLSENPSFTTKPLEERIEYPRKMLLNLLQVRACNKYIASFKDQLEEVKSLSRYYKKTIENETDDDDTESDLKDTLKSIKDQMDKIPSWNLLGITSNIESPDVVINSNRLSFGDKSYNGILYYSEGNLLGNMIDKEEFEEFQLLGKDKSETELSKLYICQIKNIPDVIFSPFGEVLYYCSKTKGMKKLTLGMKPIDFCYDPLLSPSKYYRIPNNDLISVGLDNIKKEVYLLKNLLTEKERNKAIEKLEEDLKLEEEKYLMLNDDKIFAKKRYYRMLKFKLQKAVDEKPILTEYIEELMDKKKYLYSEKAKIISQTPLKQLEAEIKALDETKKYIKKHEDPKVWNDYQRDIDEIKAKHNYNLWFPALDNTIRNFEETFGINKINLDLKESRIRRDFLIREIQRLNVLIRNYDMISDFKGSEKYQKLLNKMLFIENDQRIKMIDSQKRDNRIKALLETEDKLKKSYPSLFVFSGGSYKGDIDNAIRGWNQFIASLNSHPTFRLSNSGTKGSEKEKVYTEGVKCNDNINFTRQYETFFKIAPKWLKREKRYLKGKNGRLAKSDSIRSIGKYCFSQIDEKHLEDNPKFASLDLKALRKEFYNPNWNGRDIIQSISGKVIGIFFKKCANLGILESIHKIHTCRFKIYSKNRIEAKLYELRFEAIKELLYKSHVHFKFKVRYLDKEQKIPSEAFYIAKHLNTRKLHQFKNLNKILRLAYMSLEELRVYYDKEIRLFKAQLGIDGSLDLLDSI